MFVPVSIGELVDKITILEIKSEKIKNIEALVNIVKELDALTHIVPTIDRQLIEDLKQVNCEIWDVEDELREYERNKTFGEEFIRLARNVYIFNDKRASIKRIINEKYTSEFKEEKSYSIY